MSCVDESDPPKTTLAKDSTKNNSGCGRGKGKFNKNKNKNNYKKKVVEDFVFYIGSAKQASDYFNTAEYLVNFIKKTYDNGNGIVYDLSEKREFPMLSVEPTLEVSSETDTAKKVIENRQNELKYDKRLDLFIERENERGRN